MSSRLHMVIASFEVEAPSILLAPPH